MTDAVVIVSGGMDSVTLLNHLCLEKGLEPHVLSFDYGQRHKKELQLAKYWADEFGLRHDIIDLTGITHLISNSALTSASYDMSGKFRSPKGDPPFVEVPDGHYAEESMKATVVPNRNMIMLSIAAGVAVNEKAEMLALGVHAGDHFIYPDCRPEFVRDMQSAIVTANEGFLNDSFEIYAPFLHIGKEQIAALGRRLDVDWTKTWSCYKGGNIHCGRCGTCVERAESLNLSGFDPTTYEDPEFWKTQVL